VYRPTQCDILVELHLGTDDSVDVKSLLHVLENLEIALYGSDRDDILRASNELRFSGVVRDAALERLRTFRHQRLQISEARHGSLVILAFVASVSLYVLEKTVGEALKDSFKESESGRRLRDFFRRQIDTKVLVIAEGIRKAFSSKSRKVSVKTLPRSAEANAPATIVVDVLSEETRAAREKVRTLGEELD